MTRDDRLHTLGRGIERFQRQLAQLEQYSSRWSWMRLAIVVVGLAAAGLAAYVGEAWPAGLCAAATGLSFGLAARAHGRVELSIRRRRAWIRYKQAQAARAALDWEHIPATFYHQPRADHPFEADLDLVGERSLHQLLDTAVSYDSSQRLRSWLAASLPDVEQIGRRQQLVAELIPLHLFRGRLILNATLAMGSGKTWHATQLSDWLASQGSARPIGRWLALFAALAALNAVLLAADLLNLLPPWWQTGLAVYLALMFARAGVADAAWNQARTLRDALHQLHAVFRQLERFSYAQTPRLGALCAPFREPAHRPSRYLARVSRLLAALGVRGNPMVRLALNAVVPWDFYFAYRLQRTRQEMAGRALAWLDTWFELEALCSLANLAYLNPDYTFPTVAPVSDLSAGPVLDARGLGHPLLAHAGRVCNDFALVLGEVAVITGSNMAGKSVFMKSVGINVALANAGGPVCARELRTGLFRLYTSMAIADSVTDGISFFYAEVKRLKALLEALERDDALPLLFCIDEIWRGTNNRERLLGSQAYVRALAGQNGVGLIATHDLELARLADQLDRVSNYHFRDTVAGERMVFDYTLRPGPCPTTNALRIMRLHGLPVPAAATLDSGDV